MLTQKQEQAIILSKKLEFQHDLSFCCGGIGSGKTTTVVNQVINYIAEMSNQGLEKGIFLYMGFSVKQLKEGVVPEFERLLGSIFDYSEHFGEITLFKNRILLMPGRQATDFQRIRSFNAFGGAVNEATNIHENTWGEFLGRIRVAHKGIEPKVFCDLNPSSKAHHLYRKYFEHAKNNIAMNGIVQEWVQTNIEKRALIFTMNIFDNARRNGGFLSDNFINKVTANLTGNQYKNLVEGVWGTSDSFLYDIDELNYIEYEASSYAEGIDEADLQFMPSDDEIVICSIDPASATSGDSDFMVVLLGAWQPSTKKIRMLRSRFARKIGNKSSLDVMEKELNVILNTFKRIDVCSIEIDFVQKGYIYNELVKRFKGRILKFVERSARAAGDKHERIKACEDVVKKDVLFPREWRVPPRNEEPNYDNERWAGNLLLKQLCNITYTKLEKIKGNPETLLDGADALEGIIRETREINNTNKRSVEGYVFG